VNIELLLSVVSKVVIEMTEKVVVEREGELDPKQRQPWRG
jgi:hypothetical protein